MKRVLIAGIGNIFFGDDAFGCEVIRELGGRKLPGETQAIDFGIRSYDLAYALTENYEAVILVDAVSRGEPPGTVFLIEVDKAGLDEIETPSLDGHNLDPLTVLKLAESLGERCGRIYLVGCEPAQIESPDGRMGLSAPVQAAVPKASDMIGALISRLSEEKQAMESGLVPS